MFFTESTCLFLITALTTGVILYVTAPKWTKALAKMGKRFKKISDSVDRNLPSDNDNQNQGDIK